MSQQTNISRSSSSNYSEEEVNWYQKGKQQEKRLKVKDEIAKEEEGSTALS